MIGINPYLLDKCPPFTDKCMHTDAPLPDCRHNNALIKSQWRVTLV